MNPRKDPALLHPSPLPGDLPPPEERPELANTRRLVDYIEELWRWKYVIALVCLLGTLVMMGLAISRPNVYLSTSTLMVTAPRQGVDVESMVGIRTGNLRRYSPVHAAITLLQSNDLARRVVRKPGMVEKILLPNAPTEAETEAGSRSFPKGLVLPYIHAMWRAGAAAAREKLATMSPERRIDQAAKALQEGLRFYPDENSASIRIVYRTDDPVKARDVLRTFVEEGLNYYIECNSSGTTLNFMQEQIRRAEERYREARQSMEEFLRRHGIGDFRARLVNIATHYEELELTIRQDEGTINQLQAEQEKLGELLEQKKSDEFIPGPTEKNLVDNPEYTALLTRCIDLKAQIEDERSTSEKERLREILAGAQERLAKTPRLLEQEMKTQIRNPEYISIEEKLLEVNRQLDELRTRLEPKKAQSRKIKKELDQLQSLLPEWQKYDSAAEMALQRKTNLQSRIGTVVASKALDEQGVSSLKPVDVEELAELVSQKEGPSRMKYILAGFFGSLFGLCPLIMLMLRMSTRITRGNQLEQVLRLEVPASIPRLTPGNVKRFLRARALGRE